MESKVKIKVNKHGYCDEFSINGVQLGQGIEKLQVIVDPFKPAQIILDVHCEVEIECETATIEKPNHKD